MSELAITEFRFITDGSKANQYYNTKARSIKVSRNVAFNENEEPRELEIVEEIGRAHV